VFVSISFLLFCSYSHIAISLTGIRTSMPGQPPIGSVLDFGSFFWALLVTIVCFVASIVRWYNDLAPAAPAAAPAPAPAAPLAAPAAPAPAPIKPDAPVPSGPVFAQADPGLGLASATSAPKIVVMRSTNARALFQRKPNV
jgi:hypothetical protein